MVGTRQDNYCWPCKVFWDERITLSGVPQETSRIPAIPGIALFVNTWHDWHRGYREIMDDNNVTERQDLQGQPLRTVEIGHLPRASPGISVVDTRAIPWVLPTDSAESPPVAAPTRYEEVYIPEEDRLFDSNSENGDTAPEIAVATGQEEVTATESNQRQSNSQSLTENQYLELGDILQRLRGLTTGLERMSSRLDPFIEQLSSQSGEGSVTRHLQIQVNEINATLQRVATWTTESLAQQRPETQNTSRLPQPQDYDAAREAQRQRHIRLFGTVEDIQQPDYVSPITSMFNRQWERLRAAREAQAPNIAAERLQQMDRMIQELGSRVVQYREDAAARDQNFDQAQQELQADRSAGSPQEPSATVSDALVEFRQRMRLDGTQQNTDEIIQNMRNIMNSFQASSRNGGRVGPLNPVIPPPQEALPEDQMYIKLQCTVCLEQVADIALVPCGKFSSGAQSE